MVKTRWMVALAGLGVLMAATLAERDAAFIGNRRNWWSFQKPIRPAVPSVEGARNEVDAFLLSALQDKGLHFSPELDRERLLRRLYLDLTGLPPTPEEASQFLSDRAPGAYERCVDRLLASPHYAERWALKWLDVVRYADTNGFELDAERPHAWRYRDYVIRSFHANKPYDRFIREQIAGDELWPGDPDALIATGLLRAGPEHIVGGNQDDEMNRQEVLTEMTTITGQAFLGLTIQCARCHNHKFDPIPQSDHYRLQAVFAGTVGKEVSLATAAQKAAAEAAAKAHKEKLEPLQQAIKAIEKPYEDQIREEKKKRLDAAHLAVLDIPKEKRTKEQEILYKEAKDQIAPSWDEVLERVPADLKAKRAGLRRQMHAINLYEPDPAPAAYAVINAEKPHPTHILKVGDHRVKLDVVEPGVLQVISPPDSVFPATAAGRRTALANWLASPGNPLTARVMVNRIWQFRMGTGLVTTANDFGVLGARPSNPKLLDWLAVEFMTRNWDIRAIDRLIVTSQAYRQAAAHDSAKAKIDPGNRLYWRMNRRRVEGETLRDSVLRASGMLNPKMFGKPIRTPIEPEVYDTIFTEYENDNLWPLPADRSEIYRRSIYLLNKRTVRLPLLANFDQPDTMSSCPVRPVSTHALQALNLLNSDFMQEQSQALAGRLARDCGDDADCRIRRLYAVTVARQPTQPEVQLAKQFLAKAGQWADLCLAMLNRNEFVYVP
jgi:hypothetical protein